MSDQDEEVRRLREENARLQQQIAAQAPRQAPPPPAQPQPAAESRKGGGGGGAFIAAIVGVIAVVSIAVALSGSPQPEPKAAAIADESPALAASAPQVPPPPKTWEIRTWKDEMRDAENKTACLTSTNRVQLNWPYQSQHVDLCIRKSARHGQDAYVALQGSGQFICRSYDGCSVKVRVDDRPVAGYSASDASDGSSDIIFINSTSRFITAVRGARTILIEAEFYEAGLQQMRFETDENLTWP